MAVSTAFGWLGRRRAVPLVAALGVGVLALGFAAPPNGGRLPSRPRC